MLIAALEDSATAQVAFVLVQSIGQENPKDFAARLFARWGIGQAGADNGLLIFSVMDQRLVFVSFPSRMAKDGFLTAIEYFPENV